MRCTRAGGAGRRPGPWWSGTTSARVGRGCGCEGAEAEAEAEAEARAGVIASRDVDIRCADDPARGAHGSARSPRALLMNLADLSRFSEFLSDRDVLVDPAVTAADPAIVAVDRSGGRYRTVAPDADRSPGVWHDSAEGEQRRIASSPRELFVMLGRGYTIDDLVAGRARASGRSAPGLLAWAEELEESD